MTERVIVVPRVSDLVSVNHSLVCSEIKFEKEWHQGGVELVTGTLSKLFQYRITIHR